MLGTTLPIWGLRKWIENKTSSLSFVIFLKKKKKVLSRPTQVQAKQMVSKVHLGLGFCPENNLEETEVQ